ncbi:hypothetical protein BDP27DRAFT_1265948 [Rhodocollybia butyracea]|uniref:DUF6593 domain-containing protein n=1 Tax=Rhodocollybia butyracea TaxID=206335 RepID=A0A9P5PVC8_9AGAR|nr:hypothetical protein BDP27DRAFT_1265948 [Rhodocollybia butyracea]
MVSSKESTLTPILSPDNPSNTSITGSEDGALRYRVVTEFESEKSINVVTIVSSATGETIASWKWNEIRSDSITIGNAAQCVVKEKFDSFQRNSDIFRFHWQRLPMERQRTICER